MRPRDRASAFFGATALTVAILLVGGALRWTQAIVAMVVALSLAPQVLSRRAFDRVSPLVALLGAATVLTAIQLVPFPAPLLEWLNPSSNALRDAGAALSGTDPWRAITLDAPGSLAALAFFTILLGVAISSLRIATSERGRFYLMATVTVLCALTALIVVVHELFGLETLYGVYQPQYTPHLLGPLLNPNHLGCLMAVGAVMSIGLLMYRQQTPWVRVVWIVTLLTCSIATVATISRGATIALLVGSVVTLTVMMSQKLAGTESRRRRRRFLTRSLPIGIVATCTVFVVILLNASNVEDQLAKTSLQEVHSPASKFSAWKSSTTLLEESPWVGFGRGAFESSFTRVHPASAFATSSHLENEYLQAVVDWGICGAVVIALAMLWLVAVAAKRWRDGPLVAGALGAMTVVALQSNFDFGVELLGLAAPITAIVATLTYVPLRERQGTKLMLTRAIRAVHILALAGAAALLLSTVTATIDDDHDALTNNANLTYEDVAESIERHPMDYFAFARASTLMIRTGDSRAIQMLNHAMRLHPTHPGLHAMAGRLLVSSGHIDQATIEFGTALRNSKQPQKLIAEVVARFSTEKAAAAIPVQGVHVDSVIKVLRDLDKTDVATAWLVRVLSSKTRNVHACEQLYRIALDHNDLVAAEFAGRSCVEMVPDRAMRLALARVLLKKQSYVEVVRLLEDVEMWPGKITDKVHAWLLLCDAKEGLKNLDETKRCLRQLDLSGYLDAARRPEILARIEKLEKQRRNEALGVPKLLEKYVPPSGSPPPSIPGVLPTPKVEGSGSASTLMRPSPIER